MVAQTVKNLPAMQETQVHSLDREDPLEKEMATHSSIFAWEIPWTEEPGGLQSIGSQRVGHDWSDLARTHKDFLIFCLWVAGKVSGESAQWAMGSFLLAPQEASVKPNDPVPARVVT